MAKTVTPENTGLSIKRDGSKFTASWKKKIKAANTDAQWIRYRTFNKKWSKWTTKKLKAKATSYTFSLSAASKKTKLQVQTQALGKPTSKYSVSDWSKSSTSCSFKAPQTPGLAVSNDSPNTTTFTWSHPNNASGENWFRTCLYRTKCTSTPDAASGWSTWEEVGATGSKSYTDSTVGTTRIFQIKARGPAGSSVPASQRHIIGVPPITTWGPKDVSVVNMPLYYRLTYDIKLNASKYAVDSIVPRYFIGIPTAAIGCPAEPNWTDGPTYDWGGGNKSLAFTISTDSVLAEDQCLFASVKTIHDGIASGSAIKRVKIGRLAAPTAEISVSTPTTSGFTVDVTITDAGTQVPGAYQQVFLEKNSKPGEKNYDLLGVIPAGSSSAEITSSKDITGESGYAIHVRNVSADGKTMTSGYYTYSTSMPSAPRLDSVTATPVSGKVHLAWTNRWAAATGVQIAWTDDQDNWKSNDDPATYDIDEVVSDWFITGLETGTTWYFRVRSVRTQGDAVNYSPWSADVSIDLSAAPAVPILYLSEEAITEDGMVTAYWSYVSTDGTGQISGSIVEATRSGDSWTYGTSIAATTSAQHIDLYAAEQGWTNGTSVYLALQTGSGSGGVSDYSTPVQLVIAAKPTVSITSTSLQTGEELTEVFTGDGETTAFTCQYSIASAPTVTVDGAAASVTYSGDTITFGTAPDDDAEIEVTYTTTDHKVLDVMSLTATVVTSSAATLTVAVERAVTYPMERPDGSFTDGAAGETVYVNTIAPEASNSITIALADLIGRLDDGAWYRLVASVEDQYKQIAEADPILFKVHWAHQAEDPTATFITDAVNYIARITPIAPANVEAGDTCDIYRLSADAPELVISGGTFGTEYVDPFPAFGTLSGYKVVTVTANNDYITEDNTFAEYDTTEQAGAYTQLDPGTLVIDFGGERAELPFNITLDNSWEKDFERTVYLGGHVAGDHNRAVTRDASASTVVVRGDDAEIVAQVRALARYAGICHVRTPDGSSFAADVQITEGQSYDSRIVEYDLTIKKVDTVDLDGITYAEWSEQQ